MIHETLWFCDSHFSFLNKRVAVLAGKNYMVGHSPKMLIGTKVSNREKTDAMIEIRDPCYNSQIQIFGMSGHWQKLVFEPVVLNQGRHPPKSLSRK